MMDDYKNVAAKECVECFCWALRIFLIISSAIIISYIKDPFLDYVVFITGFNPNVKDYFKFLKIIELV